MKVFTNLSMREKILIAAALPMAIMFMGYRLFWVPLDVAQDQARADIAAFRLVQDTAALALQKGPPTKTIINETPLPTRVTRSAQDAGLTLRRIEPEGQSIRVTLDETPFSTVLLWLADMEEQHGVVTHAVEIDRRPEPGMVSAHLLLGVAQ